MTLQECPVTLDDLKKQLRLPDDDSFDDQLTVALLAAAEWCENYSGRKLSSFDALPYQLKAAILMVAAGIFENPTDPIAERTTAAQRLADPVIWQQEATT